MNEDARRPPLEAEKANDSIGVGEISPSPSFCMRASREAHGGALQVASNRFPKFVIRRGPFTNEPLKQANGSCR
ncbi:MAG: hypothetical protein ACLP1D_24465 [Xanthobacteraceae bacterium]